MTELSDRSIVTLTEVKNYLKLDTGEAAIDTVLYDWIDMVSGVFEDQTHNRVVARAIEEILDGPTSDRLETTYFPILSLYGEEAADRLANLQYRIDATSAWVNLSESEDYVFIPDDQATYIQLLHPAYFVYGVRNTRVKYWAGAAREDVPADIRKVVLEGVAVMWRESSQGGGRLGVSTEGMQGSATSYMKFSEEWDKIVNRHRKLI